MHTLTAILLAVGVILTLLGVIPAAFRRDLLERLHYGSVAAVGGIPLIAIASMLAAGNTASRAKAGVVLIATAVLNALVSHALARAVHEGRGGGAEQ